MRYIELGLYYNCVRNGDETDENIEIIKHN